MSIDPLVLARMAASQQPDPTRQHEVAMKQAEVCLDAAKFILNNAVMFPQEAQKHAQNYILRCMQGLDNIRIQEAPAPTPSN